MSEVYTPRTQSDLDSITGSPEGLRGDRSGTLKIDSQLGRAFIKRSPLGVKTGWEELRRANDNVFNVLDYAGSTDIEDNTTAFNNAIAAADAAGGGTVLIPSGTFPVKNRVQTVDGVYIKGSGASTILDFSGGLGNITGGCIYGEGSIDALPAFTLDISNSKTITFASDPELATGDILIIYNSADNSFSTARTYYRQGEFCVVESISGNVVTLTKETRASYIAGATTTIYKMTPIKSGVSDLKLISPADAKGIYFEFANQTLVEKVEVTGSTLVHIGFERSFQCAIRSSRIFDISAAVGENYGWKFTNCTECVAYDIRALTRRHGGNIGGVDDVCAVPNRQITVMGCSVECSTVNTTVAGFKIHGISESIVLLGNHFPCGVELGGDDIIFADNDVGNAVDRGGALLFGECLGLNMIIAENRFWAAKGWANSIISVSANSVTTRPSEFSFHNNKIRIDAFGTRAIMEVTMSGSPTDELYFHITNNLIRRTTTAAASFYSIYINTTASLPIEQVFIHDNTCVGAGIYVENNIRDLTITSNKLKGAAQRGIYVHNLSTAPSETSQVWNISRNTVRKSHHCGIELRPPPGTICRIVGNTSLNNAQTATGSASTDASLYVEGAAADNQIIVLGDNIFGDNQGVATQQRAWTISNVATLYEPDNKIVGTISTVIISNVTSEFERTRDRGQNIVGFGTAAPTTGTWKLNDLFFNRSPLAGGVGWICTNPGTPGDWREFGLINNVNFFSWNATDGTISIGGSGVSASANDVIFIHKNSNSQVCSVVRNTIALGNTSASAVFKAIATGVQGSFGVYPSDYATPAYRDKVVVDAASNAAGVALIAPSAGQKIQGYAGISGSTPTFEFDDDPTAGNLRFLVYDVDTGTLKRLKVGANNSANGGTAREVFVDNA